MEGQVKRTVAITGADGFIGRNLRASLSGREDMELACVDVGDGESGLEEAIGRADFVIHLAGVNRPVDPAEFATGNTGLTEKIVGALSASGRNVPVLMSSSIQAALENPYGKSKLGAEEAVFAYGRSSGAPVYVFRLPNVFGKWCRPNYNSVVATWCHNTARGLPISINDPSTELNLVYIDDVVAAFIEALDGRVKPGSDGFCAVERTYRRRLGAIAESLRAFSESRSTLVAPSFSDDFERSLYATWLSYLPEDAFGYALEMKRDQRGWLAEFIKSPSFGQVFISRTKPGITRGNHWHHTKVEKFLVVSGMAVIKFRKIGSAEVLEYPVTGDELRVVDIPAGYTHSITNAGSEDLITLFWADEMFDPAKPDTYFLEV